MAIQPEHKGIVNAIIDSELSALAIAQDAVKGASSAAERVTAVLQKLLLLRDARKVDAKQAKELAREAFQHLALIEYVNNVHDVQKLVDSSINNERVEIKKTGKPLSEIKMITNLDLKTRIMEKALAENGDD